MHVKGLFVILISFIKSTEEISLSSSDRLERSCVCDLKSLAFSLVLIMHDICHDL